MCKWKFKDNSTCLYSAVKRAESRLVVSGAKVQADCEELASPYDQTINTVEISTMVSVVELTLQVPAINVQSLKNKKVFKKQVKTSNEVFTHV